MTWLITIVTATSVRTYPETGNRDTLTDAAYDAGAMGVTAMAQP